MVLIAPSLLSANFARLGEAVRLAEDGGADVIHFDVMDGRFVPNITFGPLVVEALRPLTSLPFYVHLMIENPGKFIPAFRKAGADWISFHIEASTHLHKDISLIRESGAQPGLSLNPATPLHLLEEILPELHHVLLMSVNPGWGGQTFIPSSRTKIRKLREWIRREGLSTLIAADGGIDHQNAESLVRDGLDVVIAGSAVYGDPDPVSATARLKQMAERINAEGGS